MLSGPDTDQLKLVLDAVDVPVIASGGVGELADIATLDRRLSGVIVGRAIYEKKFTVAEGIAACSRPA
jgi:phosphoribosylformimino-5-aminoimidazole carboxamide ribonucleotide (ProFAR) isomerase